MWKGWRKGTGCGELSCIGYVLRPVLSVASGDSSKVFIHQLFESKIAELVNLSTGLVDVHDAAAEIAAME